MRYARGALTTTPQAFRLVLELLGHETVSNGLYPFPVFGDRITIEVNGAVSRYFIEDVRRIAEDHPEHTSGEFTITTKARAVQYRIAHGKVRSTSH